MFILHKKNNSIKLYNTINTYLHTTNLQTEFNIFLETSIFIQYIPSFLLALD